MLPLGLVICCQQASSVDTSDDTALRGVGYIATIEFELRSGPPSIPRLIATQ